MFLLILYRRVHATAGEGMLPLFVRTPPQDGWTAAVFRGLSQWLQPDGRFQELIDLAVTSFNMLRALLPAKGTGQFAKKVRFSPRQFRLTRLREISRSLLLPLPCHFSTSEKSLEQTSGNVDLHSPFGQARKWESSMPKVIHKGVNQKPVVQLGLLLPDSSGPGTSNTFHSH